MSEYQYYEFQAVDHHLTNQEMSELRYFSSRADITPTSFINEYSWGNFKGDEDQWMEKYFDGFLYYANWGTHILKLRIPSVVLDFQTVQLYCNEDHFSARLYDDKIILNFLSENEEGREWEEDIRLSSFLSLRFDLMRGDLRCLYLGWLSGLQDGERDGKTLEPPVPPGLASLNPALTQLAEFLRIDSDLIYAAANSSPSLEEMPPHSRHLRAWLATLPAHERENLLTDILEDSMKGNQTAAIKTLHRFNQIWQAQQAGQFKPKQPRAVAQLLKEAGLATQTRQKLEAEKTAAKQQEQQKLNQLAREKRLNEITGRESILWEQIESLVSEKKATGYDQAIQLLIDLRDLATRGGYSDFSLKLNALKQRHSSKSSFMSRLRNNFS